MTPCRALVPISEFPRVTLAPKPSRKRKYSECTFSLSARSNLNIYPTETFSFFEKRRRISIESDFSAGECQYSHTVTMLIAHDRFVGCRRPKGTTDLGLMYTCQFLAWHDKESLKLVCKAFHGTISKYDERFGRAHLSREMGSLQIATWDQVLSYTEKMQRIMGRTLSMAEMGPLFPFLQQLHLYQWGTYRTEGGVSKPVLIFENRMQEKDAFLSAFPDSHLAIFTPLTRPSTHQRHIALCRLPSNPAPPGTLRRNNIYRIQTMQPPEDGILHYQTIYQMYIHKQPEELGF